MICVQPTTTEKAKARLVVKVRASIACCATAMPALRIAFGCGFGLGFGFG